ncbi:hypothetical protein BXZ70DRAFT_233949 [Cristinia sonorae]|uniref:C2H2-type domain-containing protein n=1 Tax=Cristinia sonorae TaxID=1940300 RepID=A0A8K0UNS9_9AGAR|nr:hypothetical protein BXZ70DRAFT_233949 [Cristinia sonorae]
MSDHVALNLLDNPPVFRDGKCVAWNIDRWVEIRGLPPIAIDITKIWPGAGRLVVEGLNRSEDTPYGIKMLQLGTGNVRTFICVICAQYADPCDWERDASGRTTVYTVIHALARDSKEYGTNCKRRHGEKQEHVRRCRQYFAGTENANLEVPTFSCPFEGCRSTFGRRSSMQTHVKKFHSSPTTKKNVAEEDPASDFPSQTLSAPLVFIEPYTDGAGSQDPIRVFPSCPSVHECMLFFDFYTRNGEYAEYCLDDYVRVARDSWAGKYLSDMDLIAGYDEAGGLEQCEVDAAIEMFQGLLGSLTMI